MKNIIKQIVMNTRRTFLPPYREGRGGSWTRVGLLLAIVMMAMSPMKMWADDYTITVVDAKSNTVDLPKYLFDGNRDTKWCTTGFAANGAYIIFKVPTAAQMTEYTITDGEDTHTSNFFGRHWNSWTIYGGNFDSDENAKNGVGDWTVVDSQSGQAYTSSNWQSYNTYQTTSFTVNNAGPYKYYKLVITGIGASYPSWTGGRADDCQQMAEMSITFTEPANQTIDVKVTKSGDSQAMLSKQIATLITLNYNNGATQIKAQNGDTDENPATASLAHGYIYNLTITDATNIGAGSDTDLPDGNIIAHAPRRLSQVSELTGPALVFEGATNPVYYLNNGSVTLAKVNGKFMVNKTEVKGTVSNIYISDVHHYTTFPAVAATCTSTGNIAYQKCSVCEKNFDMEGNEVTTVTVPIDPTAHNLSHTASKAATCTAEGWHEYWHCSRCLKYFKDENGSATYTVDTDETTGVFIAITEHSNPESFDSNGLKTCSVCGNHTGEEPEKVNDASSSFNEYYAISKPGHLVWFRNKQQEAVCNAETDATTYPYAGIKGYLVNDIDLASVCHAASEGKSEVSWEPIGAGAAYFTGIFDGNNHAITGLYINSTGSNAALFGRAGGNALIQNLTVKGSVTANDHAVGILAYVDYGDSATIKSCTNYVNINNTGDYSASRFAGIAGYFNGTIDGCVNYGTINGFGQYSGGIIGTGRAVIKNCENHGNITGVMYVAGIAGSAMNGSTITNCVNHGTVTGAGQFIGGITGTYQDTSNGGITYCTNYGNVTNTSTSLYVGGILGSGARVAYCANYGDVTSSGANVGGISGLSWSPSSFTVSDLMNIGAIKGTKQVGGLFGYTSTNFLRSYSTGDVEATSEQGGLLVGYSGISSGFSCPDAYYVKDAKVKVNGVEIANLFVGTGDISTSATAVKSADVASGKLAMLLRSASETSTWGQDLANTNKAYPVLGGPKVYFSGTYQCNGLIVNETYTNDVTQAPTIPAHSSEYESEGLCTVCGESKTLHGTGTKDDPYLISNVAQLEWFRDQANAVTSPYTACAMLVNDIDLSLSSNNTWTPIALEKAFTGVFDGNNKTISNLFINTNNSYMALFGNAAEDAEIKNLTVNGTVIGGSCAALILANAVDRVKLTNCKSEGSVTGKYGVTAGIVAYFDADEDNIPTIAECKNAATITSTCSGSAYVGGIAGEAYDVYMSKCTNEATITAAGDYVGGIVGFIDADDSSNPSSISECTNTGAVSSTCSGDAHVGGIAGEAYDIYMSKCKNEATVTAAGEYVGGILGYIDADDSSKRSSMSECTNTGAVSSTHYGDAYVGGIVGEAFDVYMSKCTNEATVTAAGEYVGGIVGRLCADDSSNPLSISECTNTGTATITSTYDGCACVGGIVGQASAVYMSKCTNEATVTAAGSHVGGIAGYAEYTFTVSACKNTGDITSDYDYSCYAGGILGYFYNSSVLEMSQCYNTGKVSATSNYGDNSYIGGLAGEIYATDSGSSIKDCYTTGDVVSNKTYDYAYIGGAFGMLVGPTVSNVYAAATITKDAAATDRVGAFAGYVEYSTLTYCHYDSDKTSLDFNGYVFGTTIDTSANGGKSAADFASGEVCYLLNGLRSAGTEESPLVWYQAIGSDAYPTFEQNQYAIVKYDATDGYYNDIENCASIEIQDATEYTAKLNRTATELTYTRTFGGTNWTTWYVPFELTLTSEICAKYEFSRINNVHQYEDEEGDVDETVVESFLQNSGVKLKANYPYLVRAKSDADKEMTLNVNDATLKAAKVNSIFCQSIDYRYTFTGTYSAMGDGEAESTEYSLFDDNADGWKNFQTLKPQRHYLTITSRDGSSMAKAPRRIMLKVVGEENATGIVTLYDNTSAAGHDGKYLENGKVVIVRNGKKYNTNGQVIK